MCASLQARINLLHRPSLDPAPAASQSVERKLNVYRPLVRGLEGLRGEFVWTPAERREITRRIGYEYFWHIGYAVLWQAGRRTEALAAYRAGLREWPWSAACWKTYVSARMKSAWSLGTIAESR